jgi:hypothetical protein
MTPDTVDVKAALTEGLMELHLPTVNGSMRKQPVWRNAKR